MTDGMVLLFAISFGVVVGAVLAAVLLGLVAPLFVVVFEAAASFSERLLGIGASHDRG